MLPFMEMARTDFPWSILVFNGHLVFLGFLLLKKIFSNCGKTFINERGGKYEVRYQICLSIVKRQNNSSQPFGQRFF